MEIGDSGRGASVVKNPAVGPTRKLRILPKSNGNSRFLEGVLAWLSDQLWALLEGTEKERRREERTTSFKESNTLDAQERSADFMPGKNQKWPASPPILGGSGHEIKCVADHFGGFRAWIPERSDFFKGPKGPKGPLGPERSDFFEAAAAAAAAVSIMHGENHISTAKDFVMGWRASLKSHKG